MKNLADISLWTLLYNQSHTASFFQSPHWAMVWQRYTENRFTPAPLLCTLPSGRKILLPLSRARLAGGLVGWQHLAPAGTYGGWLSDDQAHMHPYDLGTVLGILSETGLSTTFRWFPFSGGGAKPDFTGTFNELPADTIDMRPSGWTVTADFTRVLDCAEGFGAIKEQWRSAGTPMMRNLRKAEQSGVKVRHARTPADRSAYHTLYLKAAHAWNPPPNHVYYARMWDILAEYEPESRLWLAEYRGRIVAGAVFLYGVNHVSYWHGASDAGQRGVRPVNLLMAKAIEDACERGYRWFDFNPGGGLPGVDRFKAGFSAAKVLCPVFERQTLAAALCTRISRFRQRAGMLTGSLAVRRMKVERGDT